MIAACGYESYSDFWLELGGGYYELLQSAKYPRGPTHGTLNT